MKTLCLAALLFFGAAFFAASAETSSAAPEETAMRETISYGTDNEILELLKKLRTDNIDYLDGDLAGLASRTKNQNIILGIFSFFNERSREGLKDTALAILGGRESETPQKVNAALDYLGTVKEAGAIPVLTEIVSSDDTMYDNAAIKALGKIVYSEAGGGRPDITEILLDYYNKRSPGGDTRQELVSAIGYSGGPEAAPFLLKIINSADESAPLRMAALEAAGRLKDAAALDSIIASASSADPNIRFAAIGALGAFNGDAVDAAILEGFRDTYFKARLAAVRSAKARRLKEAIPYLRYRAERDEAAAVRDEAVLALGGLDDEKADAALLAMLEDGKAGDGLRARCAEMLVKNNAERYTERIIAKLDEAKAKNQTGLYKGLLKALSFAETGKVEALAARLFASNDVTEKFYALDLTANNRFTAFRDEVERLAKDKNSSLSRRAKTTLEKILRNEQ
ncbi:MAG: HEAT repeat domain-containing protein [Spirochaetaceae bacterium]|nr:HEAT repeat domain-containing protein [Spirochaetaceae bacterium]